MKKVAILVDVSNDYSVGLQTFFGQDVQEARRRDRRASSPTARATRTSARSSPQIKAANPEAIYVPGYYTEVGLDRPPGARARHHGAAPRRRRLGLAASSSRSAARRSNGCYFSNHYSPDDPNPAVQKFVADYKEEVRRRLPDAPGGPRLRRRPKILADAMTRARARRTAPKVRDALAATKDFPGVTGKITIDEERNAVKPAVVLKIENGKFVYVETIKPRGSGRRGRSDSVAAASGIDASLGGS